MKETYKYQLEAYRGPATRHTCPACGAKKTFAKYVDANGNIIADHVGRCDRENNCGYHYTPKQFFTDNPGAEKNSVPNSFLKKEPVQKPVQYLPVDLLIRSVQVHKKCCLYPFLDKLFRDEVAAHLCEHFFVGANRAGNTVFWQTDINGKVRQAKVMQYNPYTGHRNKEFTTHFIGRKLLNDNEANLQQCFFGEYQLSFDENKEKTIGIVEGEKSAIIASVYFPEIIWLATGGKHGAKWTEADVCKVLKGRNVVLFPDVKAYDTWKANSWQA